MRFFQILIAGIAVLFLFVLITTGFFVVEGNQSGTSLTNPDLVKLARQTGFTLESVNKNEGSFLNHVIPPEKRQIVRSMVLLRDNDRVASVYWYKNPSVHQHMDVITESVFQLFSSDMRDLIDEVIEREGFAPIDVLAFTDPLLSEERFVFAVIRDQLYEFHVQEEDEGLVQGILLELAREH